MARKKYKYKVGDYLISKYYKPTKIVKIIEIKRAAKSSNENPWVYDFDMYTLKNEATGYRSTRYGIESLDRDFKFAKEHQVAINTLLYEKV